MSEFKQYLRESIQQALNEQVPYSNPDTGTTYDQHGNPTHQWGEKIPGPVGKGWTTPPNIPPTTITNPIDGTPIEGTRNGQEQWDGGVLYIWINGHWYQAYPPYVPPVAPIDNDNDSNPYDWQA